MKLYMKLLISYIYPRTMTEMNVSTTMGMSATVEEMSATVGEMSATVEEIEYGLGNLRVEIDIHNFDRLPIKVHGITCTNPIRI